MEKVYYSIREIAQLTGLGEKYLRRRANEGTIPHVKSGAKVLINYPLLCQWLEKESCENGSRGA